MADDPDLTVPGTPEIAGDYCLLRALGRGGFGTVFEARHSKTGLPFALKRMSLTEEDAERFQREALYPARIASRSLHVLGVHAFFRDDQQGYFYLVMDLVPHGDLRQFLESHPMPLPLPVALEVCVGVAKGLAAIHDQGIIHRDLKPSNVLMDQKDGRWVPKITDFGLARSAQSRSIGDFASPGYAAPEQLDFGADEAPGTDSDAFSLGVLFYEVLTGQRVTSATNLRDYGHWLRARQAPEPPSQVRAELAGYPEIDAVVTSLLRFERSRRLSSAAAVVARLSRVQREIESRNTDDGAPSTSRRAPPNTGRESARVALRFVSVAVVTAAAALLVAGSAWIVLSDGGPNAEGLTGCWSYNSWLLSIKADGEIAGFLEGGRWVSRGGQRYDITWPRSVDILTLSPDGRSLSGTNNYGGGRVGGVRAAGRSSGLAGSWRWSNGQPTDFRDDGTVTNGPVAGRWRRLPEGDIQIVWEFAFVDHLTLSPDGRSVSGTNQVGNLVRGVRVPCAAGPPR